MYLAAVLMAFELASNAMSGLGAALLIGNEAQPTLADASAEARDQEPSTDVDGRHSPLTPGPSARPPEGAPEAAQKILFEEGRAEIRPTSLPALDEIASAVKAHPDAFPILAIDGHAASSERGPMRLSLARATAVRLALIKRGVDGARLLERVSGATAPLCEHGHDACQEQERRVEFAILRPSTSAEAPPAPEKSRPEGTPPPEGPGTASANYPELLQQVTFARGSSVLAPSALAPLDLVAGFLKANPTSLDIEGYAAEGEHGASELSRARAEAVRAYLLACGVSADGLVVRARGTEQPVCRERTRACRAQNRRAELRFSAGRP